MKTIISALALVLTSLAASAHEVSVPSPASASMRTRAEVRAEVLAAVARGERLSFGEVGSPPQTFATFPRSRAEVRAELFDAMARGEHFTYGNANPTGFTGTQTNRLEATAMSGPSGSSGLRIK